MNDNNAFQTELGRPLYSHKRLAPNNLPHFPGPFVGRDHDVNNITHLLLHSLVKSVHIAGLPAVGKSTLAVHVGYEMASHGVAVRYINVDDSHIFKRKEDESRPPNSTLTEHHEPTQAISRTFTDITLSWYSHTETRFVSTTAQGLIEWAKGLSNATLLILDNCDSLLQGKGGRNKTILKVFDALSKASPYLCTVTTSRLKVNLLNVKLYNLKQLDNESAINLLQLVSPIMTLDDSRTINGLLDGIPLALKIVGSLVSEEKPPNVIITNLKQNIIDACTPEDVGLDTEKMRPVLRLSNNYLDSNTQKCALYLSHFPGSFSEDAALHILGNFFNSTPIGYLRNLTDLSLLDPYFYAGQSRYQFHKVIKEYFGDVGSCNISINLTSMNVLFNSSFVLHYTQILHYFINNYNQLPHDEEKIGRFEYESHNFECLLEKVDLFDLWTVTPVLHLTHALTCDLMLEILTRTKLLKAGAKVLVMFEHRMEAISAQIGALETLNMYRDLVLVLRKWIQSFPERDCKDMCAEVFVQKSFTTRVEIIDKQLAKTNYNRHNYYRKLQFPYFEGSICFSYCLHFYRLSIHMAIIQAFFILVIAMMMVITRRRHIMEEATYFTAALLSFCCSVLFDISITMSVGVIATISTRSNGFPTHIVRMIKHKNIRRYLTVLYYAVFFYLLCLAFREDIILTNLFVLYIIFSKAPNLLVSTESVMRRGNDILHAIALLFLVHSYVYEFEALNYVSSCILSFANPYWKYVRIFINWNFLLIYVLFPKFDKHHTY